MLQAGIFADRSRARELIQIFGIFRAARLQLGSGRTEPADSDDFTVSAFGPAGDLLLSQAGDKYLPPLFKAAGQEIVPVVGIDKAEFELPGRRDEE